MPDSGADPSTVDPTAQAGSSSYQATQATSNPSFLDTVMTDIQDPVDHPIVLIIGGLVVAGLLFIGSSKPKKKNMRGGKRTINIIEP